MATLGSLGELVLSLSADTAKFESDLGRANTSAVAAGSAIGTAIGQGVSAAIRYLSDLTKKAIDTADELNKLGQRKGLNVEEFALVAAAAEMADVPVKALSGSIRQLQLAISEIGRGKGGKAGEAFDLMGIDVKEFGADSQKVFDAVMRKLASYEGDLNRTALAAGVFGQRNAEAMIQMAEEYEKNIRLAQQLGITLDKDTAEAASKFKDNMKAAELASGAMGTRIAAVLLPTMEKLSGYLVENAKNTEKLDQITRVADTGMKMLATAATVVSSVFQILGDRIGATVASLVLIAQGEFRKAWEVTKDSARNMAEDVGNSVKSIQGIWDTTGTQIASNAEQTSEKIAAPAMKAKEKVGKTLKQMTDELQREFDQQARIFQALQTGKMSFVEDDPNNKLEVITVSVRELDMSMRKLDDDSKSWGFTFNSALEDAVINGSKFSDVLKGIDKDIARMILRRTVVEPSGRAADDFLSGFMKNLFQSNNSGGPSNIGLTEGMTGGTFAEGGRPPLGKISLVGEEGPELFVPDSAGTIIPGNGLGGSVNFSPRIHIDSRTDRAEVFGLVDKAMRASEARMVASLERGGTMAKAVGKV